MNKTIPDTVSSYLKYYADAPRGKYPAPSPEIIDVLRKSPDESFNIIVNNLFQKPENLDPRDLDAPLGQLPSTIADLVPDLLIPRMTKGFWGARYLYISSAAVSKSPLFVPTIINPLTDRSIYIKSLVLNLIIQCPHLQLSEAIPKLEKLSKMRSFQKSDIDQELLEQAKQSITSNYS